MNPSLVEFLGEVHNGGGKDGGADANGLNNHRNLDGVVDDVNRAGNDGLSYLDRTHGLNHLDGRHHDDVVSLVDSVHWPGSYRLMGYHRSHSGYSGCSGECRCVYVNDELNKSRASSGDHGRWCHHGGRFNDRSGHGGRLDDGHRQHDRANGTDGEGRDDGIDWADGAGWADWADRAGLDDGHG